MVKPIVVITVDEGPDENPRYPKTLSAAIGTFKKHNHDALFILTHAHVQSTYNAVERRMASLSHTVVAQYIEPDELLTQMTQQNLDESWCSAHVIQSE
ncbi:unnamed protein product [Didymodactylos carnosus]|uniref:Uncharacterized protein n=1 Tax=Didymodactylos carnosus TaxID=1234261 RepID=A0A816E882_9BILA|nr:unnamed protein product [Didymodactylos carnosus]CAF1642694.1 unnamed protein product [Didymodactylos carnosus]CAF4276313.1 unnamed protein product [Didymodactylos carnosus]CAF4556741.1 unnamed protein product [Didymodactylos carnosus]